ncbi:uncharacterized protein LY89DRAFT_740673 [Mollisia scopiformis]|uniref:Uncharacterized protein n=1 Tax=Mollisia scopiformis TaxID=149040 RepID=A0A132BD52_MOLSC|nr:uncharacterized protein LY89DRAFT_740673 [Mollisia scopiformis]KUJ09587.1 hypothetical protein LY89DRAFT_740673 [Mollisia scopiformis]
MAANNNKRAAQNDLNKRGGKKNWAARAKDYVLGNEDDEESSSDDDEEGTRTPDPNKPSMADMIDASFAAQEKAIMLRQAKAAGIRAGITPYEARYIQRRQDISDQLAEDSVKEVLETHLTKEQMLLFMPVLYAGPGAILEIQAHNKKLYDEALKNGPFKGQKNNIITKITMLHYGLPVEPVTLTNINNSGKDDDDPDDAPSSPPRVQRMMWAEKPLEFLDKYYERGHGFPMLRRTGPLPKPIQPQGFVKLRGGGPKRALPVRWLYSHYGGRLPVTAQMVDNHPTVTAEVFRPIALQLLGWAEADDWLYTVDQYRNQESNKGEENKEFIRSFRITKANFVHMYRQWIRNRVSNTLQDWVMVVRFTHNPSQNPATFALPGADSPGNPPAPGDIEQPVDDPPPDDDDNPPPGSEHSSLIPSSHSSPRSSNHSSPAPRTRPPPTGERRRVYHHDRTDESQEFTNDWMDFRNAVRRLLGLTAASNDIALQLNFYGSQLGTRFRYNHYISVSSNVGDQVYNEKIAHLMFSATGGDDWRLSVHPLPNNGVPRPATPMWPPWENVPYNVTATTPRVVHQTRERARLYGPTDRPAYRIAKVTDQDQGTQLFLNIARRALGLQGANFSFRVDFHSRQLNRVGPGAGFRFSHHIIVDQDNIKRIFIGSIRTYLFDSGDDWFVRVVEADNNTRRPPPPALGLPATGDSTTVTPIVTPTDPPPGPDTGFIYAYSGKIRIRQDNEQSFQNGALRLLNVDPLTKWWFRVTAYQADGTVDPAVNSLIVKKDEISTEYAKISGARDANGNWRVFVHRGLAAPATADGREPDGELINIVSVKPAVSTALYAYWNIPRELLTVAHGVNQFQPEFFRALQVHFNSHLARPAHHINIEGQDLGWGGMEVGPAPLEALRGVYRTAETTLTAARASGQLGQHRLVYNLARLPVNLNLPPDAIGIRMVGNSQLGATSPAAPYQDIAEDILDISRTWVDEAPDPPVRAGRQGALPDFYRIWYTAADREQNVGGEVVPYNLGTALGFLTRFMSNNRTRPPTNCLWFRPEWRVFTVQNLGTLAPNVAAPQVQWDVATAGATLVSFRTVFEQLLRLSTPGKTDAQIATDVSSFQITSPGWTGSTMATTKFVVTSETTETEWRRDIFDWFQGNVFFVKSQAQLDYVLDRDPPWGLAEIEAPPPPSRPPTPEPVAVPRGNAPKFNRPRLLKLQEEKAKPVAFDPWQANQNRLDRLQRESYYKNQSAIEPGQKAEPPIFGKSQDLLLTTGSNVPEIYLKPLTATDIDQIVEENRRIRNRNLERQTACAMCNEAFPKHNPNAIVAHYKEHADALAAAGKCPICQTEGWVFMDMDHKRQHLEDHFAKTEGTRLKNFWAQYKCPVCLDDLTGLEPEKALDHIAGHTPEIVRYCDRCSFDTKTATRRELDHHNQNCRVWASEEEAEKNPNFCGQCGRTRPVDETNAQRRAHNKLCRPPPGENCRKCGIDLEPMNENEYNSHNQRCEVPRGWPGTFCRRCGKDLSIMDVNGLYAHRAECLNKPTANRAKDPRPAYLESLMRKAATDELANKTLAAELERRLADIIARERLLGDQPPNDADLQRRLDECLNLGTVNLGNCPIAHCENPNLGLFTRAELYAHLLYHNLNSFLDCPLVLDTGTVCGTVVSIRHAGITSEEKLVDHYQHISANAADNGNNSAELVRLRAQIETLRRELQQCREERAGPLAEYQRRLRALRAHHDTLSDETDTILARCTQEKEAFRPRIATMRTRIADAIAAQPDPKTAASKQILRDIEGEVGELNAQFARVREDHCEDREIALIVSSTANVAELNALAADKPNPIPEDLERDFVELRGLIRALETRMGDSMLVCGALTTLVDDAITQFRDDLTAAQVDQVGFLPSPPGGYRVRGSPHKTSPRKRSGPAGSPTKAGSKRKMHIPEDEDDSYVPIPYLEVGTPAPVPGMRGNKRARTDAGSEEDYVIVGESLSSAAPTRRTTRATSGTPAPTSGGLTVKKARGRPRKDADDESPETVGEDEGSDSVVVNARASPRKGSKQSPAKKK